MSAVVESLACRYEVLQPHLTERQRWLWLGAEARELGLGGAVLVAQAVGVAADTVRRGRAELDDPVPPPVGASRCSGGGRKRAEARDREVVSALERLVDPESWGDPMSLLRWTCKSTRVLAAALRQSGHQVSEFVVRRLLKQLGYSLQANAKTAERASASRSGCPVRLPQRAGQGPPGSRLPGDQRGHQEKRTRR